MTPGPKKKKLSGSCHHARPANRMLPRPTAFVGNRAPITCFEKPKSGFLCVLNCLCPGGVDSSVMANSVSLRFSLAEFSMPLRCDPLVKRAVNAEPVDTRKAYDPNCVLVASLSGLRVHTVKPVATQMPISRPMLKTMRSSAVSVAFSNDLTSPSSIAFRFLSIPTVSGTLSNRWKTRFDGTLAAYSLRLLLYSGYSKQYGIGLETSSLPLVNVFTYLLATLTVPRTSTSNW